MAEKRNDYIRIKNCDTVKAGRIPVVQYNSFVEMNASLLSGGLRHLSHYFAVPDGIILKIYSLVADDEAGDIICSSAFITSDKPVISATALHGSFHPFERDIHETHGVKYIDHPWLKPLRFPSSVKESRKITDYPFLSFDSEELHEVGVGPIHAGVIEPGHFRFICNGEKVLHLEIQLGYQHRGVEDLFIKKKNLLEKVVLSESIAGDTTIGHASAFASLYESLCGFRPGEHLSFARALAIELERMAVHTGDLAALSGDVAYQLGNAVFGRLRTPLINYAQSWFGNRLGRGLVRPGKINFPFTARLAESLSSVLYEYEKDYTEMADTLFARPGVQARFEKTGTVSRDDSSAIGSVGMAARASGLRRDVRATHPYGYYAGIEFEPAVLSTGDVFARAYLRDREVRNSLSMIREMIADIPAPVKDADLSGKKLSPDSLCVSMAEGWRGEICHAAITGKKGEIVSYKIKDPSMHNWFALALAVRGQEISDFPLCNKSFNLSYCGHDL